MFDDLSLTEAVDRQMTARGGGNEMDKELTILVIDDDGNVTETDEDRAIVAAFKALGWNVKNCTFRGNKMVVLVDDDTVSGFR